MVYHVQNTTFAQSTETKLRHASCNTRYKSRYILCKQLMSICNVCFSCNELQYSSVPKYIDHVGIAFPFKTNTRYRADLLRKNSYITTCLSCLWESFSHKYQVNTTVRHGYLWFSREIHKHPI